MKSIYRHIFCQFPLEKNLTAKTTLFKGAGLIWVLRFGRESRGSLSSFKALAALGFLTIICADWLKG